ncbi:MAG: hypothetical protein AB1Z98_34650 [Nannocystaceae bacterium]
MMLAQRCFLARWLGPGLALALMLAGVGPSARAAAPSGDDFEQLVVQADEHAGAGRHAAALGAYADAFEAMSTELRATPVGEFVALAAGKAALDDFEQREDPAALERGRAVLEQFLAAIEAAAEDGDAASSEAARSRLEELVALMPEPEAEPDLGDGPAPLAEPKPVAQRAGPSRTVGIALVAAGGASVLGGIGLVVAGARQVPWYEERLLAEGWDRSFPEFQGELDNARRVRNIDIGIGAALLGVGVGLGVAGGVILAKAGTQAPSAAALSVGVSRRRAMLGARWRF